MSAYTSGAGFRGGTVTNATTFSGVVTMGSDLDHDGTSVGFYGVAPVARPAAYTQTYSTASRSHPALTSGNIATTGATNTVPFGFTTAAQANAIVSAVNAIVLADLPAIKQLLNQLIDDLQALGLLQ